MTIINQPAIDPIVVDPATIARMAFEQMERSWNRADGAGFGEVFADETDFVNIHGTHLRGDGAFIARGHQVLFDTIYADSTVRYRIDVAREIAPGCVVAVVAATMKAPTGPLQGVNNARITVAITEQDGRWRITAFHNTLVGEAV
jgi:uncharacterized protein (TIGR02246 family)